MDLLTALESLDVDNEAHWTAQGLPKVDVLKEMAGDSSITRQTIDALAPDYTRSHRYPLIDDVDILKSTYDDHEVVVQDVDVEAEQQADQVEDESTQPDALTVIKRQIEEIKAELKKAKDDRRGLDAKINDLQSKLSGAQTVLSSMAPQMSPIEVVKQYQKSQMRQRSIAAGLDPDNAAPPKGPVSTVGVSRLDQVSAQRRRAARSRVGVPTKVIR